MPSEKFSVSTSQELFEALEALREDQGRDRSSLIEMLLREHPLVRGEIRRRRQRDRHPRRKRDRDDVEIDGLARAAKRQWDKREADGEVAFLDR